MKKSFLSVGIFLMGSIALPLYAGTIALQPMYTDSRFPPVDAFHAGCTQEAKVLFEGGQTNISKMHLVLGYSATDLQILRVTPVDDVDASYKIEAERIVFDTTSAINKGSLFQLSLQGDKGITSSDLIIQSGSYIISKGNKIYLNERITLPFASVAECTPDIIPPSVKLVYPLDSSAPLTQDQYFVFAVNDAGKGVDPQSISITIDGQTYFADAKNIKWNNDQFIFYPQTWLPLDQKINLSVAISDKQIYGGANTSNKKFTFETSDTLTFQDNIDPITFRQIAKEWAKMKWSLSECLSLQAAGLTGISEKLACDIAQMGSGVVASTNSSSLDKISVFAFLGWILFAIVFGLKLHYMAAYRKHKKMNGK